MAVRTKNELRALIQSYFPDNDSGLITAANTRLFLDDIVDSLAAISPNAFFVQEDSTTITNIPADNVWIDINNVLTVTSDSWNGNGDNTMTYTGSSDQVIVHVSLNFVSETNNREFLFKAFIDGVPLQGKAFVQGSSTEERQATWIAFGAISSGDVLSIKCLNRNDGSDITVHDISGFVGEF